MEDEARAVLRPVREPRGPGPPGRATNALFRLLGGFDLPEAPREARRFG